MPCQHRIAGMEERTILNILRFPIVLQKFLDRVLNHLDRPPIHSFSEPPLADMLERGSDAVGIHKILNIERLVLGHLVLILHLLLHQQHLRDVGHLDGRST